MIAYSRRPAGRGRGENVPMQPRRRYTEGGYITTEVEEAVAVVETVVLPCEVVLVVDAAVLKVDVDGVEKRAGSILVAKAASVEDEAGDCWLAAVALAGRFFQVMNSG